MNCKKIGINPHNLRGRARDIYKAEAIARVFQTCRSLLHWGRRIDGESIGLSVGLEVEGRLHGPQRLGDEGDMMALVCL